MRISSLSLVKHPDNVLGLTGKRMGHVECGQVTCLLAKVHSRTVNNR